MFCRRGSAIWAGLFDQLMGCCAATSGRLTRNKDGLKSVFGAHGRKAYVMKASFLAAKEPGSTSTKGGMASKKRLYYSGIELADRWADEANRGLFDP